ncbi:MAG: 4-(cytidine 5'-diphospho)-2-C-methyl-D-erythritol kinase [Actinomycetia bacterium]|nr:4-(cytidine 5'-diphospho)-2-C-methyl-D-erythritol kinase [Actinomycetes bacterium]
MTSAMLDAPAVTVRVPAKVNLELRVGPPGADGFHPLATVFQAVSLFDEVTVTPADEWDITISGSRALGVPADESNLALRAARLLAESMAPHEPVSIHIEKEIPVAGGMAGGSADAAATLVACDRLWGLDLSFADLEGFARALGSDVPFLLHGGTAVGSRRGDLIAPALTRGTYHWVFATSDIGLSTPDVYAEFDRLTEDRPIEDPVVRPELLSALRAGDPYAVAEHLHNDLQEAAVQLRPELGGVLADGLTYGALAGIVSGSGPTVAFLAGSHELAIDLAVALTATGAVSDVHRATGPVHGASLRGVPRID